MFKSLLKILMFILMILVIIVSLSFSSSTLSTVKCDEITVIIPKNSPRFIDEEEIYAIIIRANANLLENQLDSINTETLEQQLSKVAAIKNAEVFRHISSGETDFKGTLIVKVEQREPIFRVLSGTEDYYLDNQGVKIPGSQKYAAHVLLATGKVDEQFAKDRLLPFVNFIIDNEFWNAQIKQIEVLGNGEIILAPLIGDQLIEFGEPDNYQVKLRNLKALYDQGFSELGWEHYKKISLKYNNQVVCTKN